MNKFNTTINTPLRILFPNLGKGLGVLKRTFETLFSIIIFLLIPLIVFTLITSRTPAIFGLQSFTVLSGSMSPLIPTGSIVYTQKVNKAQVGDVITFERKGVNITHRVIEIVDKEGKPASTLLSPSPKSISPSEVFYKVKGDANSSPDSDLVPASKIIGKVSFNVSLVGKYASYLKTIPGFLMFIIGPTLIFIGFELWNIKKEIEKQTERKVMQRFGAV